MIRYWEEPGIKPATVGFVHNLKSFHGLIYSDKHKLCVVILDLRGQLGIRVGDVAHGPLS